MLSTHTIQLRSPWETTALAVVAPSPRPRARLLICVRAGTVMLSPEKYGRLRYNVRCSLPVSGLTTGSTRQTSRSGGPSMTLCPVQVSQAMSPAGSSTTRQVTQLSVDHSMTLRRPPLSRRTVTTV